MLHNYSEQLYLLVILLISFVVKCVFMPRKDIIFLLFIIREVWLQCLICNTDFQNSIQE